jgi:hypothetical protein
MAAQIACGLRVSFFTPAYGSACELHSKAGNNVVLRAFYGAAVVVAVTVGSGVLLATKPSGVMDGVGLGPSSP